MTADKIQTPSMYVSSHYIRTPPRRSFHVFQFWGTVNFHRHVMSKESILFLVNSTPGLQHNAWRVYISNRPKSIHVISSRKSNPFDITSTTGLNSKTVNASNRCEPFLPFMRSPRRICHCLSHRSHNCYYYVMFYCSTKTPKC